MKTFLIASLTVLSPMLMHADEVATNQETSNQIAATEEVAVNGESADASVTPTAEKSKQPDQPKKKPTKPPEKKPSKPTPAKEALPKTK